MSQPEKKPVVSYLNIDLHEWIQHAVNLEAYKQWRDDPITQTLLNGIRRVAARLNEPTGEKALQELGFMAGRDSTINLLQTLDRFAPTSELSPDYNRFKYLVEVEHYTTEDAQRIIAEAENG